MAPAAKSGQAKQALGVVERGEAVEELLAAGQGGGPRISRIESVAHGVAGFERASAIVNGAAMRAVESGEDGRLRLLIAAGADVDAKTSSDATVAMDALKADSDACLEIFLEAGTDIEAKAIARAADPAPARRASRI